MIVSNYTKLFSIEFLHDFYRDTADAFRDNKLRETILQDISINPDEATLKAMNGYRIKYKLQKNKLICFVQTIASIDTTGGSPKVVVTNKPLVTFDENTVLTFKIFINSARFLNNSNLRRFDTKDKILKLGNDSGNKRDALLSLSQKIPTYKTSDTYSTGMLVTNAGNLSFEAIKDSDPAHPQNTTKIQFWSHITDFVQYVNQADLVTDTKDEKCFGLISISFKKNLKNDFSLLKKSNVAAQNNLILGKEYLIHFKTNAAN
jgi:hypothetical protein